MKFGVTVTNAINPNTTASGQADYVNKVTMAVEQCGLDSVWVADRTFFPVDIMDRHPEMFSPHHSKPDSQNLLESVTTLSYTAALTKRVLIGFSVLCLPFRHPLLNSKMLNTIDVLSNGRALCGIGVGWLEKEFEVLEVSYSNRGKITNKYLEKILELWGNNPTDHLDYTFEPKPIQQPSIPIWVGGNSKLAINRAVKYGDAWHPTRLTPKDINDKLPYLYKLLSKYGKDKKSFSISLKRNLNFTDIELPNIHFKKNTSSLSGTT